MLNIDGMNAYVARPAGPGPHPGVVVGHLLFGLDATARGVADRLAGAGFLAVVPDLYHRSEPLADLPVDDEGRRRGFALIARMRRDEVLADVGRAVDWLRGPGGAGPRVGMLGVSFGGHVAFLAAAHLDLAATATLFPGWLTDPGFALSDPAPAVESAADIKGRLLFLVGDRDHVVPPADIERIARALAPVDHELVVYPGAPHAFFPGGGEEAEDAWRRILGLFDAELRRGLLHT